MDKDKNEATNNQTELSADNAEVTEEKTDPDEEVLPSEEAEDVDDRAEEYGEEEEDDGAEEAPADCADEEKVGTTQQKDREEREAFIENLLKEKISLKTGEEEFIFSRGPKYSDDKWPVNCHVCRKGNFVTLMQIKNHVKGASHRGRYSKVVEKPHGQYMKPYRQNASKNRNMLTPISISPGEVIGELTDEHKHLIIKEEDFEIQHPPEDVMKKFSSEPMHEYNKKLPLIGLCYMYRMQVKSDIMFYFCFLCNTPKGGFKHVTSPPHQFKYIEKHFPKLYAKVKERLRKEPSINYNECVINIFRKLYRKIENAKGFREILFVDRTHFYKNKNKYMNKMYKFVNHYDENTILITEHEVDILITKCISRMEFIKPDHKMLGEPQREEKGRHMKRVLQGLYDNEGAAWQRYHFIMKRELEDLNLDYQGFDRNPKSHPAYFKEEKKFFSRAGNDKQKLNRLKREWMPFWKNRLRDFYDIELTKRKLRVKTELRLRIDIRTPSPEGPPRQRVPPNNIPSSSGYNREYADGSNTRDNIMDIQPPPEPLGVISVLRLLTALEDQLGSLGPKAVQFLSKAVLAEKSNQNPNDLMMDGEVYLFLVTAKEKLKGQIYADIVDEKRVMAVNRAISDATNLLDMFEDYTRRTGKRPTLPSTVSTTTSNQFQNTGTTSPTSSNQIVATAQSDCFRTDTTPYTSNNNGSTNQNNSNQGGHKYSGLNLNPYQTESGSGNMYSSSGGNGGNNLDTPAYSSNQYPTRIESAGGWNQYSSGQQYGTNSNRDGISGNYQGTGYSASNSFGARSGNFQGTGCFASSTPKSFGAGSGNFQGTGSFASSTPKSFGAGSGNFQSSSNSFGTGQGNFQGSGYSARNTPNQTMTSRKF